MHIDKLLLCPALALVFLSVPLSLFADGTDTTATQPLFFIERSKNANEVHYVARLTENGDLDIKKPVHAFWINWAKDSTGRNRSELTLAQKQMAFGFSIDRPDGRQSCTMKLACFKNRPITISLNNGTARAETIINGLSARLNKISVVTLEKQKLLPKVLSVTVYGTNTSTGEEVVETIKPR